MFALFFIFIAVLNLICILANLKKLQAVTKCLLVPSLALFYVINAAVVMPAVMLALVFCTLGDFFLLKRRNIHTDTTPQTIPTNMLLGIMSFLFGIISYIISVFIIFKTESPKIIVIILAIVCFFILSITNIFKKSIFLMNPLRNIPVIFYAAALITFCVFSLLNVCTSAKTSSILLFTGSLLFMISDIILVFTVIRKNQSRKANFFVMLLYGAAQFNIVLGFLP